MRDQIIAEIRRLAEANGGQAPGYRLFLRETNIAEHKWRGKFWARWGDALVEAGYSANEWVERLDSEEVLNGVVAACRHYGRFPTTDEIKIYRKSNASVPTDQVLRRHFGTKASLVSALAKRARENKEFADIASLLPSLPQKTLARPVPAIKFIEGYVYLIQAGTFFKIGRSDDIERRIKEIRVALPDKATLIHTIETDDPAGIEAYWHQRFKEKRANGEWFKLNTTDVVAFKRRKFQ